MLEGLEKKEKELRNELIVLQVKIHEEKLKIIFERYGVQIGSTVKDAKGAEYRVVKIKALYFSGLLGKPWVSANPKKKDGSFGIAVRNLYSEWELVRS